MKILSHRTKSRIRYSMLTEYLDYPILIWILNIDREKVKVKWPFGYFFSTTSNAFYGAFLSQKPQYKSTTWMLSKFHKLWGGRGGNVKILKYIKL